MYFILWPKQSVRKGSGVFRSLIISFFSLIIVLSLAGYVRADASVVINEIHYDPDVATELVEFIELHNFGSTDVNLSGWYFSDGISFRFPAGAILQAGGYIIVRSEEHT
ncbi:MAG: lamin tail domain-containing protein, partial [Planctomycetes bacterium]|nr:lamin tail domain-containing protein [Planctomycetota bacterium]